MKEFVQIDENLFVQAHAVVAVKRSSLEEDKCVVYMKGQSALEGFVVNATAESVIEDLEDDIDEE